MYWDLITEVCQETTTEVFFCFWGLYMLPCSVIKVCHPGIKAPYHSCNPHLIARIDPRWPYRTIAAEKCKKDTLNYEVKAKFVLENVRQGALKNFISEYKKQTHGSKQHWFICSSNSLKTTSNSTYSLRVMSRGLATSTSWFYSETA